MHSSGEKKVRKHAPVHATKSLKLESVVGRRGGIS
jgi:hypothetical protein